MASIKWLQRIIVSRQAIHRLLSDARLRILAEARGHRRTNSVAEMHVKAEIAKPAQGETVPANSNVRVHGAAWTSDGEITKVELSTDGGSTWNETNLLGESKPNAWRLWEFNWKTPSVPGKQTLVARATDSLGQTQPVQRDPDRGTYMITHLLPILVQVS